jgi:hypothetical protein
MVNWVLLIEDCKIKINGNITSSFEVKIGVSLLFFNITIEEVLQTVESSNKGIKIGVNINILDFADKKDLVHLTQSIICHLD